MMRDLNHMLVGLKKTNFSQETGVRRLLLTHLQRPGVLYSCPGACHECMMWETALPWSRRCSAAWWVTLVHATLCALPLETGVCSGYVLLWNTDNWAFMLWYKKRQGQRNRIHGLNAILRLCHFTALIFHLCVCLWRASFSEGSFHSPNLVTENGCFLPDAFSFMTNSCIAL